MCVLYRPLPIFALRIDNAACIPTVILSINSSRAVVRRLSLQLSVIKHCMRELSRYSDQATVICKEGMRKTTEKLGTFGVSANIRTRHYPSATQKCYVLSQIARSFTCPHLIYHDYYHFECQELCLDISSSALKVALFLTDILFNRIPCGIRYIFWALQTILNCNEPVRLIFRTRYFSLCSPGSRLYGCSYISVVAAFTGWRSVQHLIIMEIRRNITAHVKNLVFSVNCSRV
jgi:hypothetical protein